MFLFYFFVYLLLSSVVLFNTFPFIPACVAMIRQLSMCENYSLTFMLELYQRTSEKKEKIKGRVKERTQSCALAFVGWHFSGGGGGCVFHVHDKMQRG